MLKLLEDFERQYQFPLRLTLLGYPSESLLKKENRYWSRFFNHFSHFLYNSRRAYDPYVASVFKIIKTFIRYLEIEKSLPLGEFYRKFRIPAFRQSPLILSPARLKWLITDADFDSSLSKSLKKVKDIFVAGCTLGLRYGDLMQLKKRHLLKQNGKSWINYTTSKTSTTILVPVADYVDAIFKRYCKTPAFRLLPKLSNVNFNLQIKSLAQLAGWTELVPRLRQKQGRLIEIKGKQGQPWRFCDQVSSHTMRRTTITSLLLLGVDESCVRSISGHSAGSRDFYRYVGLVQSLLDEKVRKAYVTLLED